MDIDLKKTIEEKIPDFFTRYPGFLAAALLWFLEKITHVKEIQVFFNQNGNMKNLEFIDSAFEYLDFQCLVSDEDMKKIPSKGKLICVANHKLGLLDGLSLLKTIGTVRPDVKIVVSDVVAPVENLTDLFLFYDLYSTNLRKSNLEKIRSALLEEYAVIFFPAGSVAKLTARGIRECSWRHGPVLFARKYGVPVLPIYVDAENSLLYYLVTLINPGLSTLFLSNEMFKKRSKKITLKIGKPIPKEEFERQDRDVAAQTEYLKDHVLGMGKE